MKYLVLYRVYDKNYKYEHFVKYGQYQHPDIDYIYVDEGGCTVDIDKYDRFVWLDSTVYGPHYPKYLEGTAQWVQYYERMREQSAVQVLGSHPVNDNRGIYIAYPHIMTRDAMRVLDLKESVEYRCLRLLNSGIDIGSMLQHTLAEIVENNYQIYEDRVDRYEVLFADCTRTKSVEKWNSLQYIVSNSDLYRQGLKEDDSIVHFRLAGRKEKRRISSPINDRYLTVCLADIGNVHHGICRQFNALAAAIVQGYYSRRHVVTDNIYADTDGKIAVLLNGLFDIDHLNHSLREMGIDCRVIVAATNSQYDAKLRSAPDSTIKNCVTLYQTDHTKYLHELYSDTREGVNVGVTVSDSPQFNAIILEIIKQLRPTAALRQIVDTVKSNIGLAPQYLALHVRLEDDILQKHYSMKNYDYERTMRSAVTRLSSLLSKAVSKSAFFVATGLGKGTDCYNFLLSGLRNVTTTVNYRSALTIPYAVGNNMDALVDYLICRDSSLFIGTEKSSFSKYASSDAIYIEHVVYAPDDKYCILKCSCEVADCASIHAKGESILVLAVAALTTVTIESHKKVSITVQSLGSSTATDYAGLCELSPGVHTLRVDSSDYTWKIQ